MAQPPADAPAPAAAAPAAPPAGVDAPETFTLYRHGPVTVVGWDGADRTDAHPADFLEEVADLVTGAAAAVLAVDLGGLDRFRPGLLGGLAALERRGTRVLLFDPTPDTRALLAAAKLDRLLAVHTSDPA